MSHQMSLGGICARPDGHLGAHRSIAGLQKHREAVERWNKAHPESRRASYRRWDAKHGHRYLHHGITEQAAFELYEFQGGLCIGCETPFEFERLDIDHDHSCCPGPFSCGSCVRALLCTSCNVRDVLGAAI